MKSTKSMIILCVIILLLACGLYFVENFTPNTGDTGTEEETKSVSVLSIDANAIRSISVVHPEGDYILNKSKDHWTVKNNPDIPLVQNRITTLLGQCMNLTAYEIVGEKVDDLTPYGLAEPKKTMTVSLTNGKKYTFSIGHTVLEGKLCYFTVSGDEKIYTKSLSSCESLIAPLSDYISLNLYTMEAENIGSVTLAVRDADTIQLENEMKGENTYQWKMKAPLSREANSYGLGEQLLPSISSITASEVIPVPDNTLDYGFEDPKATLTVKSLDKAEVYTITVGQSDEDNSYVMLNGSSCVYKVPNTALQFLSITYLDLVNKLVHIENIVDMSQINISGFDGTEYQLTINGQGDNATYAINGVPAETTKFKTIYQSVIGISLDGYSNAGGGSKVGSIEYIRTDAQKTIVTFYGFDDRNYLVKVNGEGNLLVRKKQVETLISLLQNATAE